MKLFEIATHHPNTDPATLAAQYLDRIEPSEVLYAVALRIEDHQRRLVRDAERDGLKAFFKSAGKNLETLKVALLASPPPDFLALLQQGFSLGDGQMVLFGDATMEEFLARRALLVEQQQAIGQSIVRIDMMIQLLEGSGARTLNEALERGKRPRSRKASSQPQAAA